MGRRVSFRSSALLLASAVALTTASCGPPAAPARSVDPNADVVVPYSVAGGGVVRLTVRPRYLVGQPITLTIDYIAGSRPIRGPLSGRVLASGLEGEKVVRTFAPAALDAVDIAPGQTGHSAVTWDGRDDAGVPLPADTYSLALDFVIGEEPARFGSVIQIARP
ncbi:MAG TPA: hypothetical protein VFC31_09185 [Candidatus Limnocylindria bacterium]|nr:hypothetical protein [Candidatus Limnocylindria bacterium]